jgi:hypothetical protein
MTEVLLLLLKGGIKGPYVSTTTDLNLSPWRVGGSTLSWCLHSSSLASGLTGEQAEEAIDVPTATCDLYLHVTRREEKRLNSKT